jgi:hypothetical protein
MNTHYVTLEKEIHEHMRVGLHVHSKLLSNTIRMRR